MAEYITPDQPGDEFAEILDTMIASIQATWPDWRPNSANLDYQILYTLAQQAASDRISFSSALTSIFRWFGLNLVPDGQPQAAVAATGTVAVVPGTGADGQTIPAGTTYGIQVAGDVIGFEVASDQTFANPAVTLTGVPVTADRGGTVGNDLSGAMIQVDSLGYVASVTLEDPTSGGVDAEDDPTYLDRLASLLQLQAPRPITPDNFAVMARSYVLGVERAVAIDGYDPNDHATYDPDDPATWKERYVTVSAVDADGADVGSSVRSDIDVLFNGSAALGIRAKREVNFVVAVVASTYTPVSVTWAGVAWPTWAPSDVEAQGNAALAAYLSSAQWGQPTFGEARAWENTREVTIDGLYAVLRGVEGLRNVTSLTFGESGGTDDFSADSITAGLWALDAGGGTISVAGGVLDPSSTAFKAMYRTDIWLRNPDVWWKLTTAGTVTAGSWSAVGTRIDALNRISANLDAASGQFRVRKTDAGVGSTLGTPASVTVATGTTYYLRCTISANTVTGRLYSTPPPGGTVIATVTHTLTGGDITKFGSNVYGSPGIVTTPASAAETYDDFVATGTQGSGAMTLRGSPGPVLTQAGTISGTVV